jgi:hypothetical protein
MKATTQKVPPKLYKYQPYNIQTLDNLKNRQIWFSKPEKFNDPFDYSIRYDLGSENLSIDELNELHKVLRKYSTDKNQFDRKYSENGKPNTNFEEASLRLADREVRKNVRNYISSGVACFAKEVDNILMWGHYTNGHRGFCLEFETSYPPFQNAQQVIYSNTYPLVNPIDVLLRRNLDSQYLLFTTKSNSWDYEKEWRVMIPNGNQAIQYNPSALSSIYFGWKMPYEHREIIHRILSKYPPKNYYMMSASDTEYKVTIDDFLMPRSSL